ncbi:UDP-N-acetyl-D-mannosamine dehydrogenase [Cronobacter sakazakii]|nr:UDP-N-acetyl-D-mannosamine dehydrogenase [Cronobacter sakazakii]
MIYAKARRWKSLNLSPTGTAVKTLVVEPNIHTLPTRLEGKCKLSALDDALAQADVLVMLVDHQQFKAIDGSTLNHTWVVDTKGVWR